jgi:hypothetical protein
MARCQKITTGTGAVVATLLAGGSASIFYGISAVNNETSTTIYVKLYWEGTGTAPGVAGSGQSTTTLPAVATTVPQLTLQIPSTGLIFISDTALNNGGHIWFWVTSTLADGTAQTALATGGDLITLIYD